MERTAGISIVLVLMLSGCSIFKSELESEMTTSTQVSTACSAAPVSERALQKNYQAGLANLTAQILHVSLSTTRGVVVAAGAARSDSRNLTAALADLQGDIDAVYTAGNAGTRAAMKAVQSDLLVIRTDGKQLSDSVIAIAQAQAKSKGLDLRDVGSVASSFTDLVSQVLLQIQPAVRSLHSSLTRLGPDIDDMLAAIASDPQAARSINLTKMQDDIDQAALIVGAMLKEIDAILAGNPDLTSQIDFNKDVIPLVQEYAAYEVARLSMTAVQRGAIDLEHKLDKIDQSTWSIITVVELLSDSALADGMQQFASKVAISIPAAPVTPDASGTDSPLAGTILAGLEKNVYDSLFIVACQHLSTDPSTQSGESVRVDQLLRPFYQGLALSYYRVKVDDKGNPAIDSSGKTQVDLQGGIPKITHASLTSQQLAGHMALLKQTKEEACDREPKDASPDPSRRLYCTAQRVARSTANINAQTLGTQALALKQTLDNGKLRPALAVAPAPPPPSKGVKSRKISPGNASPGPQSTPILNIAKIQEILSTATKSP